MKNYTTIFSHLYPYLYHTYTEFSRENLKIKLLLTTNSSKIIAEQTSPVIRTIEPWHFNVSMKCLFKLTKVFSRKTLQKSRIQRVHYSFCCQGSSAFACICKLHFLGASCAFLFCSLDQILLFQGFVANLLKSAFPHLSDNQIKITVTGLFNLNQDIPGFKVSFFVLFVNISFISF